MTPARAGLPAHVRRELVQRGVMTEDRVTDRPVVRHCRRCGAGVVSALVDGTRADVGPRPLTPRGEWLALSAGRCTYRRTAQFLGWRAALDIRLHPASAEWLVHASHVCGGDVFDHLPLPARQSNPEPVTHSDEIPF